MLNFICSPIGNLNDISMRSISLLEVADFIYAEDTRNTNKLLTKFNINKKSKSSLCGPIVVYWTALSLAKEVIKATLKDGIFFKEYVEGVPGYQPERLGPYTSTFNPGSP